LNKTFVNGDILNPQKGARLGGSQSMPLASDLPDESAASFHCTVSCVTFRYRDRSEWAVN
jgi:hypothetical protein